MNPPSQTPRSLALGRTLALGGLMLALSGCSSIESADTNDQDQGDDDSATTGSGTGATGNGEGEGDGDGEGEGDGDGDGDGDEGAISEERGIAYAQCETAAEQVVAYDLVEAQAELAPVFVREQVLNGSGAVPMLPLTGQPFLNHFTFHYPPASSWEPEISPDLWKLATLSPSEPGRYRLQFAVRGPQMAADLREPVDLVVVVDLGPSMVGEPLELAEEALAAIEAALVPGDRVTLIGAGEQPVILSSSQIIVSFGLTPLTGLLGETGSDSLADVGASLGLAYELVEQAWEGQGQARVLLISNGHFPVQDDLVALVEDHADAGHYLVSLGLGAPELLADAPLRQLAAQGRGPLLYTRTAEELWSNMQGRFAAHMLAAATELEVSLILPPGLAIRVRDQPPAKVGEPQRALLGPNDQLVFHHELEQLVACGELAQDAVITVVLDWVDPIDGVAKQAVWEQPVAGADDVGSKDLRKGAATVAYVRALRGYRDGKSPSESFGAVLDAIALIADALDLQPEDKDLIEMSKVLGRLEG